MTETILRKSTVIALDPSAELRQHMLHHWGEGDATCVGQAWDGVIWGAVRNQRWTVSQDSGPDRGAKFRWETLQKLRIFSVDKELRVWRRGEAFEAILLAEGERVAAPHQCLIASECFRRDLDYELIRSPKARQLDEDFVALRGLAGQLHFPPGPVPSRLNVRLYYQANEKTGLLRCVENRILKLVPWR